MTTKVWNDISRDSLRMVQYTESPDGRWITLPNGERKLFPRHEVLPNDAFTEICEPQQLLDELLKAGYRPSSNAWSSGHVSALEKHIAFAEDMARTALGMVRPVTEPIGRL